MGTWSHDIPSCKGVWKVYHPAGQPWTPLGYASAVESCLGWAPCPAWATYIQWDGERKTQLFRTLWQATLPLECSTELPEACWNRNYFLCQSCFLFFLHKYWFLFLTTLCTPNSVSATASREPNLLVSLILPVFTYRTFPTQPPEVSLGNIIQIMSLLFSEPSLRLPIWYCLVKLMSWPWPTCPTRFASPD